MQLLWIYGMFFLLLGVYGVFGGLIDRILGIRSNVSLYPVTGYVFVSLCFQVISIPMQLLKSSLSLTAYVYILVLFFLFFCLRRISKRNLAERKRIQYREFCVLAIVIAVHLILLLYNMCYGSVWDTSQYIGQISTALYTDTMNQYEPYSGRILSLFDWKDCFVVYEMHSAAICRLFHIHPMIYIHRILASLEITFVYIIYYNIAMCLLRQDKKKVNMALIYMMLINLFTYSLFTWSGFLLIRTAESKSMLANVILPLILLWVIHIVKDRNNMFYFLLTGTVIVGLGFGKSGAFIIPCALFLYAVPVLWTGKIWSTALKYGVSFIPCALYIFIYMINF